MELSDLFGADETGLETRCDIEQAIGNLTFREAAVLYLWAMCEKSQAEIGAIIGLSQQHVSRILADMCKKA
jgi:DNA-directed RNA polymerase specialized sigma subunit